ncbi:thioredoxin-like protein [Parasitella parasitica]|nr:thioredoxin-like protein [Parasitella parasitica]
MKYLCVSLTLLLACLTFCKAAIVQVTDENFTDLVGKDDEWLLDFYADWCGYCKRLEPKYQAAERLLSMSSHSHVKVGAVNVETNPGLAARFFVSRLPTIVHIKDHEVRSLKPTQRENEIVSFVTMEEWRQVDPKSGLISPFSLFGKLVGFTGKTVKKLSSYSPWTLIGVLTGFLIFAISLPVILSKKDSKELEEPAEEVPAKAQIASATKQSPELRSRRSKRID